MFIFAPFVLGVNSADYAEEYFQTDQLWPLWRHCGGFQDNETSTEHRCLESSLIRVIAATNSKKKKKKCHYYFRE